MPAATVLWTGNSIDRAGVRTGTVTAVAVGGTLTATINGKAITYTCVTGDTTSTAAAALQALLDDEDAPPEFKQLTFTVSGAVITATGRDDGRPFFGMTGGLVFSAAGGAAVTEATVTAPLSKNDVSLAANWLRAGVAAIPATGDTVILADSSVALLYNLTALAAVQIAVFRRYASHTGQVGLPRDNPDGFLEYLPQYFQFVSSVATLPITLGEGAGTGPDLERYDVLTAQVAWTILSATRVDVLGSDVDNTISAVASTVNVATLPTETAALASAVVDGGGTLNLGPGVTFSGELNVKNGSATLASVVGTLTVLNGSTAAVNAGGLTYATVVARDGSNITWPGASSVSALTLAGGSTIDFSPATSAVTVVASTIDADCTVLDPNNRVTWSTATNVNGQVQQGPFQFTGPRTVKIT